MGKNCLAASPSSSSLMDQRFLALTRAMGAEAGDNGYFRGILGHAPFLLKMTGAEQPGYFFKFRRKGVARPAAFAAPQPLEGAWHEKLAADHAAAEIRCDVEEDYVFLWIDKPQELTADSLAELAPACVRDHAALFPTEADSCIACHRAGSAVLVQANSSIATICPDCLEEKQQSHSKAVEKLNASDDRYSFLVPLGLLAGSGGWALFWGLYDAVFKVAKVDRIQVPTLLLAVVAAFGFGIGWPMGKILHRAGASKQSSPRSLAIFFVLLITVGGEALSAAYTAYRYTGRVDFGMMRDLTLPFIIGDNPMYAATKICFAVLLGVGIFEAAKQKEKKLAI